MNKWLSKYEDGGKLKGESIFDEGAKVAREEYLKKQYQGYLSNQAQKGRDAVRKGNDEFAENYLIPIAKTMASFTPAGPAIGLTDAYWALKGGDKVGAALMAGAEALPYGLKYVGKGIKSLKSFVKGANKIEKINKTIPTNIVNAAPNIIEFPKWEVKELPGLHLKSTMEGQAISKIIEPKTGLINTEQALAIINKESGGAEKVALIRQSLGKHIPAKMDYNQFRQIVQNELIPLERQFSTRSSHYGINRLKYGELKPDGLSLYSQPIENNTLILGNKGKFGRGSSAHGNPEETLGHIHFLRDAETPDVLTVTQIQSDAFQGTNRTMPKGKEEALFKFNTRKDLDPNIDALGMTNEQKLMSQAEIENFSQKSLLDKNHQERYLQELVDYAGKRGDVNKVRVPTSETAAKVQGYRSTNTFDKTLLDVESKVKLDKFSEKLNILGKEDSYLEVSELSLNMNRLGRELDIHYPLKKEDTYQKTLGAMRRKYGDEAANKYREFSKLEEEFISKKQSISNRKVVILNEQNSLQRELNYNPKFQKEVYSSEHQTILKKYSEQPKTIKKLFGQDAKIVTNSKGNTWYEFDIPKKFKEGKGEIKAFNITGAAIGAGGVGNTLLKDKKESGGWLSKYEEGGKITKPRPWLKQQIYNIAGKWDNNKPQLMKDFPITDIVSPYTNYLANRGDESSSLAIFPTPIKALPSIGSRSMETIPVNKLPKKVYRGVRSENISKILPEDLLNPEATKIRTNLVPNAHTTSDKFIAESFANPNDVLGIQGMINSYNIKRPFAAVTQNEAMKFLKKNYGINHVGGINKDRAASILRKEGIEAVYNDLMGEAQYQFLNNDLLELKSSKLRKPTPRIIPTRVSWDIQEIPIRKNGGWLNKYE